MYDPKTFTSSVREEAFCVTGGWMATHVIHLIQGGYCCWVTASIKQVADQMSHKLWAAWKQDDPRLERRRRCLVFCLLLWLTMDGAEITAAVQKITALLYGGTSVRKHDSFEF